VSAVADLVVDTDALRSLDTNLKLVVDTLDRAESLSRTTAAACGDGGLAEVIEDFADDWEDTRSDMLDAVRSVSDAVHMISDAFETLDETLVNTLLGKK
jgi:hypothetical protein